MQNREDCDWILVDMMDKRSVSYKLSKGVERKAQEEIAGFVLIVIMVSIMAVIFLSLSLRKQPTTQQDALAGSFLTAFLKYTSDCEGKAVEIKNIVQKCALGEDCNGEDSCAKLETESKGAIKSVFSISEEARYKGYEFDVLMKNQHILSVKEGRCKGEKTGAENILPIEIGDETRAVSVRLELCG